MVGVAAGAAASRREELVIPWWLIDTGCGQDVVGEADVPPWLEAPQDREEEAPKARALSQARSQNQGQLRGRGQER